MLDNRPGFLPDARDAFDVEVRRSGTGVWLAPQGELDMSTAPRLRAALDQALASAPTSLVLDLRGLEFMDARAIAECCRLQARAHHVGLAVEFVRARPGLQRIFELAGVTDRLQFVDLPDAG